VSDAAQAAARHLAAADGEMASLVERIGLLEEPGLGPSESPRPNDLYGALVRAIVGQQLSVTSARAIFGRLVDRFGGRTPTPEEVLLDDPEELRVAVGLSHAKVTYLRSLAERVRGGRLELDHLKELEDDVVVAELTAVKGLGVWTAHMFMIFTMQRPDVLAVGDLGIRHAFERVYGLGHDPTPAEMEHIAEPWRPWRSYACRYLWASAQNAPL
jgi:DNA-3-methyladenine glycosylase II